MSMRLSVLAILVLASCGNDNPEAPNESSLLIEPSSHADSYRWLVGTWEATDLEVEDHSEWGDVRGCRFVVYGVHHAWWGTHDSGEHLHALEAELDVMLENGKEEVAYDTQPMALAWYVILGGPIGSPMGFGWSYDRKLDTLHLWSPRTKEPKLRMKLERISDKPIEPDFPAYVFRYQDNGRRDGEKEEARYYRTTGEQDGALQPATRPASEAE